MLNIQNKEDIKEAKEKDQVICKDRYIRITLDFPMETLKVQRTWISVLQTLKRL